MNIAKYLGMAVGALLVIVVFAAPIGPLPGFFIGGTATAAPADWPDTSNTDEITLKVSGGIPRVVIIWVIEHNEELYVVGAKGSGWVSKIGTGSAVEMRLGDNTYPLQAVPVAQGWEPIMQAYIDKYEPDYPDIVADFPPAEEAGKANKVFKLSRS